MSYIICVPKLNIVKIHRPICTCLLDWLRIQNIFTIQFFLFNIATRYIDCLQLSR